MTLGQERKKATLDVDNKPFEGAMGPLISKFGAWQRLVWRLGKELLAQLWVRVLFVGAMAVVALGVASLLGPTLPDEVSGYVSGKAADRLLSIIAGAMLAVTTFSLTVMVTVYRNSSSQFTPRVHRLIMQDPTTQNTLASFIGAYVYALVGIILRELQIFSDDRALVLFVMTVLVLIYVVWSLVRWVLHLQTFGSLMDTTRQIEKITRAQFKERLKTPCLGANPWTDETELPEDCESIRAPETGYVQHFYHESLDDKAREQGFDLYMAVNPGKFVMEGDVIAYGHRARDREEGCEDGDMNEIVQAHFKFGDVRTYNQDPRFGLMVLGEVASKALSPGINDPGTAIDVITRSARILSDYQDETKSDAEVEYPRLWVRPLSPNDLIEDAFGALARDGAGVIEVQQRLQSALGRLIEHPSPDMGRAAFVAAGLEFRRARAALTFEPDVDRLRKSTAYSVLDALDSEDADDPLQDDHGVQDAN